MRRWIVIGLITAAAVTAALAPRLSRFLIAAIHDPSRLPALAADARIHFEPAAEICADSVAAALPGAMRVVEAAQGRPFAQPPLIGVYASFDSYAEANGLGDPMIAAVTFLGRVLLSPTLCAAERPRMIPVLVHELSHLHLFGWRGLTASRPPSWFVEGLAVMVSGGAGAEDMSEEEARARLREGHALVMLERGVWSDFSSIAFSKAHSGAFAKYDRAYRQRLGFRQAAMFVAWLESRDGAAFRELLLRLEDREDFPGAFEAAYGMDLPTLLRRYLAEAMR